MSPAEYYQTGGPAEEVLPCTRSPKYLILLGECTNSAYRAYLVLPVHGLKKLLCTVCILCAHAQEHTVPLLSSA